MVGVVRSGLAGGLQREFQRIPVTGGPGGLQRGRGLPRRGPSAREPRIRQGTHRAQPRDDGRVQSRDLECDLGAGKEFANPAPEPQRTSRLGLDLPDGVGVIGAGQDHVCDGDRLGRVLRSAEHGQAAQAQREPFRLGGLDCAEGQRRQPTRITRAGTGQLLGGLDKDLRDADVAGGGGRLPCV